MDTIIVNNDAYRRYDSGNVSHSVENFSFSRKLSKSNIDDLKMDLMPGFSLSWHYSAIDNLTLSYSNDTTVFKR